MSIAPGNTVVGIGIDIGSTAAKAAVVKTDGTIAWTCVMPTGCSSVDAAIRAQAHMWGAGAIYRPLSVLPCVYWEELIDR